MRIVVCIKQVPGASKVDMDPVTRTMIRDARRSVINPYDSPAVELAVRIKETRQKEDTETTETIALSMGIPGAGELLRDAVARGLDRSVLITDRAFAGADTLATSYTLSMAIRKLGGADLILCGKMAIDGDTAQTGPELAERLDLPHVTDVCAILSLTAESITVRRHLAGGSQVMRVRLPALLTVAKDAAAPHMPSIAGIRRAMTASHQIWHTTDLDADPARIGLGGSPTQVVRAFTPERRKTSVEITGEAGEQAAALTTVIRKISGGPANG
ncbi:MAG TPA: electron transfer flavoprotein subunit beta [Clostridiales bacterium]|nr:electron transfer flavoprotein subunit beta [Clostridiales bacterium]